MNLKRTLLLLTICAAVALNSCSGTHNVCVTNCSSGNATVSFTLAAIPLTPPAGTSILSFAATINSISMTPSGGGSDVIIPLNNSTYIVDLARLQSDSAFLGQVLANVPAGTYSGATLGFTGAVVTYCTQLTPGTPGCTAGSTAQFTKGPSAAAASNTITVPSNAQGGLQLLIDFNKVLTVNAVTQAVTGVDFTVANALAVNALPPVPSSLGAAELDYVEDFTGVVTAASSTSVTVANPTLGSITANVTSSTIGSPNCVITNNPCAATVGQVASIDTTLNDDGTFSLLEYDPLTPTSADVIEGIVTDTPLTSTNFRLVVNNYVEATSNSLIGSNQILGAPVVITLSGSVLPFVVDSKGLPTVSTNFSGSTSATDILPGQTVAVRITAFTPAAGNVPAAATADAVMLRFTRVSGSVFSVAGSVFNVQSLPPFFGQTGSNQVQTSSGSPSTYYDGYSGPSSITVGNTVSVRTLYWGLGAAPSFTAAKVRKH